MLGVNESYSKWTLDTSNLRGKQFFFLENNWTWMWWGSKSNKVGAKLISLKIISWEKLPILWSSLQNLYSFNVRLGWRVFPVPTLFFQKVQFKLVYQSQESCNRGIISWMWVAEEVYGLSFDSRIFVEIVLLHHHMAYLTSHKISWAPHVIESPTIPFNDTPQEKMWQTRHHQFLHIPYHLIRFTWDVKIHYFRIKLI